MSRTKNLALAAMFTALSVVLIWLSAIVPTGSLALVALVGIITGITVIECGYSWAVMLYAATAVINFLVNPDFGVTLFYAVAAGWYPVVKSVIERGLAKRSVQYPVKLILMTVVLVAYYLLLKLIFVSEFDSLISLFSGGIFGGAPEVLLPVIGIAALDVIFLIYDHALSLVLAEYARRRHKRDA